MNISQDLFDLHEIRKYGEERRTLTRKEIVKYWPTLSAFILSPDFEKLEIVKGSLTIKIRNLDY